MATKYIQYCSRTRLSCSLVTDAPVVLCIEDSAILAPTACPLPATEDYVGTFVAATICQAYTNVEGCGQAAWYYTFAYSDAVLADVNTPLVSGDITGVFCRDCLTDYLDYKAGSEVYVRTEEDDSQTLVSQHGCEYPIVAGGGEPLAVTDTASINLTINGTIPQTLSADVKITEVTTVAFNALVAGSGFTAGATYCITDHSQGRVPAATRIYLQATSVNQVTSACSVLTSYDTKLWRGTYDVATNKLFELSDNQGNTCRQFPDPVFGPFTCIDDFDWGNTNVTNCFVDNATLTVDYGNTGTIDRLIVTGGSTCILTGWVGTFIAHLEISNFSTVDFANGNMEVEEVYVYNGGILKVYSNTAYNFLFYVTIADSGFVLATQYSDSELYMEGTYIQGYSGVYHNLPGILTLFGTTVTGFGEVRVGVRGVPPTPGSMTDVWVENCTISGSNNGGPVGGRVSGFYVTGTSTEQIYIEQSHISSNATIRVDDATLPVNILRCSVDAFGLLYLVGGGDVIDTHVVQGELQTGGFDLDGVYMAGKLTKTCTANNTNTAVDYFNDSII